jgi:glycosyltransferase involved in cell wall biosynthesis
VRILYLSNNRSDHNRRFVEQVCAAGHQLWFLDVCNNASAPAWLPPDAAMVRLGSVVSRECEPLEMRMLLPEFRSVLQKLQPDLIHAGPVQSCGYLAALSGFHPLLVMSWGSDMLMHANQNSEWAQATETTLRCADGFFCDCNAVRAAANEFVLLRDDQVVQFPWGIRRGSFSPQGLLPSIYQPEGETIRLISTRSWEPLYDVDVLLSAFRIAHQKDLRLRLLLLGSGSMAALLDAKIKDYQLRDVVTTPGWVPGYELPKWFRAAHIYVSCAKSDGTSISLLEAMATGLPVVVSDLDSNREWVTEGQNGWLAPAENIEQFAQKILCAARLSSAESKQISLRNQQVVRDRADWDRNFPALLMTYERLLSATKNR